MQQRWLVLAAVALSWLVSCQALFVEPVLALGALAILKGAAIAGFKFGRSTSGGHHGDYRPRPYYNRHRWGRAAGNDPRQVDDVLLSSVTQMDPDGCLLKLLCLARATPAAARTPYQASLVHLFADITQAPTPAGIPFVQALHTGSAAGKATAACQASHSSCPLSEAILHGMLVQAWGAADQQQTTPTATPAL
ncbi:uncharacterized protein LOC127005200 [Eriocheir sinensis]|uniref:uncharacterized protein LOC127005200 n=1 Tax=Eriocheir sinensis TaxID=95602 RepID=UPI0021C988BC|nr:uncharacterized protein LOC127005200 [Eriocheir sinensis]